MSETTPTALSSFSPILHATFEASLKEYEKKTEKDLHRQFLVKIIMQCDTLRES